ncbi:MAG: hypothetical protein CL693_00380 [Cellvibrionaceae bacterium]|nr:hypothetical protein [Cellvibrionaceae bacterium]|tara:strand:- start:12746 stop:13471 length:726 start_codon:yes stop_codon:yes gene_type:complete
MLNMPDNVREALSFLGKIQLFEAFVDQQEKQITEYSRNFDQYIEQYSVEKYAYPGMGKDEEGIYIDQVNHISGISEEDYDLQSIFTELMPTYQRRSILITLFSTFEVALKNLLFAHAETIGRSFNVKKSKEQKNISVLEHWLNQAMDFGMELQPTDTSIDIFADIHCLRLVRNSFVHDDGMKPNSELKGYIQRNPHLNTNGSQITMESKYVIYAASRLKIFAETLIRECLKTRSMKTTATT